MNKKINKGDYLLHKTKINRYTKLVIDKKEEYDTVKVLVKDSRQMQPIWFVEHYLLSCYFVISGVKSKLFELLYL